MENAGYDQQPRPNNPYSDVIPPPAPPPIPYPPPPPYFQSAALPPGAQWVVVTSPLPVDCTNFRHAQSRAFGITLVVLGGVGFLLQCINYGAGFYGGFNYSGWGFWCGSMCIIAGAFGISASKQKTQCKILGFMVLSIITATMCFLQLILVTASTGGYYAGYGYDTCSYGGAMTLLVLLALEALAAGIVAICGSTLGCRLYCSGNSNTSAQVPAPNAVVSAGGPQLVHCQAVARPSYNYQMVAAVQQPPAATFDSQYGHVQKI